MLTHWMCVLWFLGWSSQGHTFPCPASIKMMILAFSFICCSYALAQPHTWFLSSFHAVFSSTRLDFLLLITKL